MDIIETVRDRLKSAGCHVDDSGVITLLYPGWRRLVTDFIHIKVESRFDCNLWHHLLFDTVFGHQYVPSPCFNCYKVVVKFNTVEELFNAYDVMKTMNLPSKCGSDGNRHNTDKLYAAYFYNYGLDEGHERYEMVVKAFPGLPVILKRGCTEYEQACGPSDTWEVSDEQREIEKVFFDNFTWGAVEDLQSPLQIAAIKDGWIKKAYQWGDKTYLKVNGGKPLYEPLVTYHKEN